MIFLNLYNMIMVDSSSAMRTALFEEFFSPTRIVINHQRFDSFKKLSEWCLKTLYSSVDFEIPPYEDIEKRAFSSPSFSIVLDSGLYIPHLKINGIKSFYSIFVVLSTYPIEPKTKKEVMAVFMLFSPLLQEYFEKHLNILGMVSGLLREPSTIEKLSRFKTPDEVYLYLKKLL